MTENWEKELDNRITELERSVNSLSIQMVFSAEWLDNEPNDIISGHNKFSSAARCQIDCSTFDLIETKKEEFKSAA